MNDLKVFNNTIDLSHEAQDYLQDNFTILDGPIILELYKPFYQVYCEVVTPSADVDLFTGEYWDGSSWQPLEVFDGTRGLTRSGWIKFYLPEISGVTKIKLSRNTFECVLAGINIVFSDDVGLKKFVPDVVKFLPKGSMSGINYHVAARDEIIQKIRNQGKLKKNLANFEKWDILDINQIKIAAEYLALHFLYANVSNATDKYEQLSRDYYQKFADAFDLFYISLDYNDDGKIDSDEKSQIEFTRIMRI